MRPIVLALLLLWMAWPAFAQEANEHAARCSDPNTEPVLRGQACTWLIDSGGVTEADAPDIYFFRGNAYRRQGLYEQAIADYDQVIRLAPRSTGAYSNRGNAYRVLGDYDRAIDDFDQVLRLAPDHAPALNNRGIAYKNKGQLDRALADYNKAISLRPYYAIAYHNRAQVFFLSGDHGLAIADFQKAVRYKPDYATAHNDLAWLLATAEDDNLRDGPAAVKHAETSVGLEDTFVARDTLAAALAEAGRFAEAADIQQSAIDMLRAAGRQDKVPAYTKRLERYRQGKAVR